MVAVLIIFKLRCSEQLQTSLDIKNRVFLGSPSIFSPERAGAIFLAKFKNIFWDGAFPKKKTRPRTIFDFCYKDISVGNYKCSSCTVSCGNRGALATHMKAKHSNQGNVSILKYVQPKHIPFWKVVAIVGACWVAKQLKPGKLDPARMTFCSQGSCGVRI